MHQIKLTSPNKIIPFIEIEVKLAIIGKEIVVQLMSMCVYIEI